MSNWPGPPVTPAMVGTFKAWAGVSLGRSQSQPYGLRHPGAPTSTAACKLVWRGGAGRGASPLSGRPCPHTCISGPSKSGKPPQGENVQSSPPPRPSSASRSLLCDRPAPARPTAAAGDTRPGRGSSPAFAVPPPPPLSSSCGSRLKNKPTHIPSRHFGQLISDV